MAKRSKKKNRRRRRRHKNPGVGAWVGSFLLTGLATGATNVLIPGASLPVTIAGLALVGSDTIKVEDKSVSALGDLVVPWCGVGRFSSSGGTCWGNRLQGGHYAELDAKRHPPATNNIT